MAALAHLPESGALGLARRLAAGVLCVAALASCHQKRAGELYVSAGSERRQFRPVSSYAESLVLPGLRHELRLTFASYAASCDSFVAPGPDDVTVIVTVMTPIDVDLGPGTYVWAGHSAHGGSEGQPERPYALPTLRLGHQGLVLQPGGEIRLDAVGATADGRVRGLLNFDFAGDAIHPATSMKGSFEAKLCHARP